MVKDHSDSESKETRCRHMGYFVRLTARDLLYAPSHRQDNTYHRQDNTYHRQDGAYHRQDGAYHRQDGAYHRQDGAYRGLCYTSIGTIPLSSLSPTHTDLTY